MSKALVLLPPHASCGCVHNIDYRAKYVTLLSGPQVVMNTVMCEVHLINFVFILRKIFYIQILKISWLSLFF